MATTIVSFAPSHAEENRFKQLYQLKKKQCHREIEIGLKEIFSKDISKLEMAAQISEERNCPIDQITEKDIEEKFAHNKREDADRRERLRQELIQEEDELEKKKGKSPKAKKISAAHPKQKQNHEINTPAKPPVLKRPPAAATLSPAELRSKYLISLYERPTMQEHPRVTKRWRTKNAEEIRNFEDTLPSGERIKRYEKLSESQIRYLRACHYLPALEKIFAEGRDKSIYTFRTEKGVGMAAILHYDNQQYSGFINFGIGSDGFLYHRFFEKTAPGKLFEAIQRKGEECLPAAPAKDEEKWTSTSKFNFDVLEDGAIHVSYPDEEHAITIFPIRKELMDASLKS